MTTSAHDDGGVAEPPDDDRSDDRPPATGVGIEASDQVPGHAGSAGPEDRRAVGRPQLIRGLAVALVLGGLGLVWSLASPVGSAPDSSFHLSTIWCSSLAPDDACDVQGPAPLPGRLIVEIPAEIGPGASCNNGLPDQSAACQSDIVAGGRALSIADDGVYPGLYHEMLGALVGDDPVDSVLRVRMATWVLSVALLAGGIALLPRRLRRASALMVYISAVPLALFVWASANPSGPVVAAVTAAWCATIAISAAERRGPIVAPFILLGVAGVTAAGSRADGGSLVLLAVVVAATLEWRPERSSMIRSASAIGVAATGFAASFLVLTRRLTSSEQLVEPDDVELGQVPFSPWGELVNLPFFLLKAIGDAPIGWLDTPMPAGVVAPVFFAFFGLCFLGLGRCDLRKSLALLGAGVGGLLLYPYYLLWRSNVVVGVEFQPRYFLPLIPILGMTAVYVRASSRPLSLASTQSAVVLASMVIAHALALHTLMRRYISGLNIRALDLDTHREWWWTSGPSPTLVWLVGSVLFGVVGVLIFRLVAPVQPVERSAPNTAVADEDAAP